jgi:hypothetical protein
MASANTTNQLPLLKRLYGNKVSEPMYKASAFLAKAKKDTSFGGEGRYVNVRVGPTSGGSASFSDAQASQDATQEKRFFVTHRKQYEVFSLQGDLIARSRGNPNAIVDALKNQTDGARRSWARRMSRNVWSNGGGSRGQISASQNLASATMILRNPADVLGFEPGWQYEFSSDDGSSASPAGRRGLPDRLTVVSVQRDAGTVTFNAALNTVSAITVNDFVHERGSYAAAMTGIRGWNPVAAPTGGDNFFGLDRSVSDVNRLSGFRVSGAGKPKEETIIDATVLAHENSITANNLFVNSRDFGDVVKELGAKSVIQIPTREPNIGFRGVQIDGANGTISVLPDADVPRGNAWLEDPDDIYLRTAGDCPMVLNEDKVGSFIRSATDDAYEGRLGAYGNLFHENPGNVIIITW